ncbi:cobalamin biosynthesis protein [Saccharomonospora viridis]|uniref:Cobalamin biosynthesis protein CobD n=4 Tax=Saccharomonospora viridis TaxID=1852 RepID=C7MTR5_SACVD|nr:cobalamin biosynthesis protein [Saccharomonospora viridis]ACU96798.1 adenosylcobinamide-phosphate synthase [Saccharomonospora viridis DSM 43017]KHF42971.1 cobalamin biosynthesis protein CobD [Saccharomonospora viridis]SFO87190.1 adenosylcobinamide-phosphate synthase [Saccharomonospora viridis]
MSTRGNGRARITARVATAVGLGLGFVLDRILGDPARYHPVAGLGRYARALEAVLYRDSRVSGVVHHGAVVVPLVAVTALAQRTARSPIPRVLLTAAATWTVVGGRSLVREGETIAAQLERGDLAAAREQVTHLVGRDPRHLDPGGVSRAVVESLAENTSDAVVAPLLWGAALGVPGLVGYRAVNTLDAMIGHRSPRYHRFGWAGARVDDLANLVPSRVAAALAVALAPTVGGRRRDALRAWRRDAFRHPSPNAGPVEAAFAGALGVTLGGVNHYAGRVEHRAELGDGPAPTVADLPRAARLATLVAWAAGGVSVAVGVALAFVPTPRRRRRR